MRQFYLILLIFLLFFSCKKQDDSVIPAKIVDDFSGLKVGNISFYNVKYIYHDDQVDRHDTITFKMKSIIEDTFIDNAFNLRFKIHRYRWNDTINAWQHYKVLSSYINNNYLFEIEDNITIKKMHIPYVFDFSWNSNSYNLEDSLHFRYKQLYSKFYLNQFEIDSVLHVKQQFYKTYVDLKRKDEYYAKNKGLVSKYYKDLRIRKGDTLKVDRGEEWYFTIYKFEK